MFAALERGEHQLLRKIYREQRAAFLKWVGAQSDFNEEEQVNFFQDVVILFYKSVLAGHLDHKNNDIKGHLLSIGKSLLDKRYSASSEEQEVVKKQPPTGVEQWSKELFYEQDHHFRLLQQIMSQLSAKCQQLLLLRFYHNHSGDNLEKVCGCADPASSHHLRQRCLEKLRSLVRESWSKLS